MFRQRTLFIIGAGASCEVNLPAGKGPRKAIASCLNMKFDRGQLISGSPYIADALGQSLRRKGQSPNINAHFHAARSISNGIYQATSIDSYMDAHRGNEEIDLCGKLAIVQSILEAERSSTLFANIGAAISHEALEDTWYAKLFQLLIEGRSKSEVSRLFENVSFIVFNYDRCLEHFLLNAIQSYYHLHEQEAASILRDTFIYHPYGVVGKLPWQDGGTVRFGEAAQNTALLDVAYQIKTFTQRIDDEVELAKMRSPVTDAHTVVFLGFAFHSQNMELLKSEKANVRRIYASAHDISDSDVEVIQSHVLNVLSPRGYGKAEVRNQLKCTGIFREYWRSLSN